MTYFMSSLRITFVQSTCEYLKCLHAANIRITTVFSCAQSHRLVGCMATDVKYAHFVFELQLFIISSQLSVGFLMPINALCGVEKTCIRDDLNPYLLYMQMDIPKIVRSHLSKLTKS